MFAFVLALASKPMAITLSCLLLLLDFWPLRRVQLSSSSLGTSKQQQRRLDLHAQPVNPAAPALSLSRAVVEKVPLLALSAASAVVTVYAQSLGGAMRFGNTLSIVLRFENAIRAYAVYVWKAFFPIGLAPIYPHPGDTGDPILLWQIALAAAFLVVVSLLVWRKRGSAPYLLVGWLWFLGTLVPVIGIVQVGTQAMADRYAYIPLIGIFVMAVWSVADFTERGETSRHWAVAISVIVLATFSFLTWRQLGFWHTNLDLWAHTAAVTSNNFPAEANLGVALVQADHFDDAAPHFKNAIRMYTLDPTGYANIGADLQQQGRLQDAITYYELALAASTAPKLRAGACINLWTIYTQLGDFALARKNFELALTSDPQTPRELVPAFRQSVNAHPSPQGYLQLGELLQGDGDPEGARWAYERALRLDPDYAGAKMMLAQLNHPAK
jgi:Tfp pilus assembly protein PilF